MNSSALPSRNGRAISAIDGKIYVAGGENLIGHSRERSLFQYDISTDKWSKLKDSDLTSTVFEPAYEANNGEERSFGVGMNFYEINEEHNKGPFTSKKEYVVYQNILMFDIKQY